MTSLQASCVAIDGRGLLILGEPGSGKSSLALALIDRGATLVGDDGIEVRGNAGMLYASPHPRTRGLLEVRNLGLLDYPVAEMIPIAIALRLDPGAERFVEQAESIGIAGVGLPLVRLWPDGAVLALKAELALRRYGLPLSRTS